MIRHLAQHNGQLFCYLKLQGKPEATGGGDTPLRQPGDAEVVEREPIEGGLRIAVRGTNPGASGAILGALRAHAPFLEEDSGSGEP